jgi:hypothetical protein
MSFFTQMRKSVKHKLYKTKPITKRNTFGKYRLRSEEEEPTAASSGLPDFFVVGLSFSLSSRYGCYSHLLYPQSVHL